MISPSECRGGNPTWAGWEDVRLTWQELKERRSPRSDLGTWGSPTGSGIWGKVRSNRRVSRAGLFFLSLDIHCKKTVKPKVLTRTSSKASWDRKYNSEYAGHFKVLISAFSSLVKLRKVIGEVFRVWFKEELSRGAWLAQSSVRLLISSVVSSSFLSL